MARRRRARPAKRRRARRGSASRGFLFRVVARGALLLLVATIAYGAWLDLRVRAQFEGRRWQVPARIYARALELYPGASLSLELAIRELKAIGYHPQPGLARPASYHRKGNDVLLRTRSFRFWDAEEPERRIRIRFRGAQVASIHEGGREAALARLEPVLIGRIHPGHREDRVLVRLADVPEPLVNALLAVEDRRFFEHHGVSPRGIARALLANLRAGGTVQGGSTLTQQLAKSYFLSAERSLWRKINDALIALLLEARYSKLEILEAYLNEVYLGQEGTRAIHGFGLAARHYFGRRLAELNLPEVALLVAMVKGPSLYNPRRHPERVRERRDLVIAQMLELGMLDEQAARRARRAALGVTERPGALGSAYPDFLDLVRRQLRRDYREEDLQSEGLRVFTTLDPVVQDAAQATLTRSLPALERNAAQLQGAVIVSDTQSGEVLAVVGGRDPSAAGFNRALDARRPIGSLIKPVVYLQALGDPARFTLGTPLDDAPLRVAGVRGEPWEPGNYDGKSHGFVPLIRALANSYNLATVRLGMEIGVESVRALLGRMGMERDVAPYPSLLLGAVDLSPMTVTEIYQTIAGGGFRQPLRAIRNVTDARGRPLERYGLELRSAVDPRAAFLVTRAMQEVMASGTGRRARAVLPPDLVVAGKTGTTDDLRDSWFAGFGGDRLAVVWVGRDDNGATRLTGASGALEVWSRLMAAIRPRSLAMKPPEGLEWYPTEIDAARDTGSPCTRGQGALTVLPYMREAVLPETVCTAPGAPRGGVPSRRMEDAQ
jgi:penicillin-binding protein 1B